MRSEGFAPGFTVYLDIETGAPLGTLEQAYIQNWCQEIVKDGYTAGVYCPGSDDSTISQLAPSALLWVADIGIITAPPNTTTFPTPDPSGSGHSNASSWQYQWGYVISTPSGSLNVDLDTSSVLRGSASDTTAPTLITDNQLIVQKNGSAQITTSFLRATDPDNSDSQIDYVVNTGPAHGRILLNGNSVGFFTQQDIDNGNVQYQQNGDNASNDSFTFWVLDTAANSTPLETFNIEISTPDTSPPALVHEGTLQVTAGQTVSISESLLQFDDNVSPHSQETYSVITGPADGILLKNGVATSSFTQADIDNGLISYHETLAVGSPTSDSFTFKVTDAAGNSTTGQQFLFQISPAPDTSPPAVVLEGILQTTAGQTATITSGVLEVVDSDNSPSQLTFTVTSGPSNGTLLKNGSPTSQFTQDDIDNNRITYDETTSNATSDQFSFLVADPANNQTSGSFQIKILSPPSDVPSDFNGDGTSDILFQNTSSGDTGFWKMSDGASTGWVGLGGTNAAYHAVATGDFFGSGTSDILFENVDSGDTGYWQMSGGVSLGFVDLGGSNPAYHAVATGDFDGDGTSDILFENFDTGDTGYWIMKDGASFGWKDLGGSNPAYQAIATGDYLGNGASDILFQNRTTGDTGFWKMNNGIPTAWVGLGGSNPAYHAVG